MAASASSNALLPRTGPRPLITSGLALGAAAMAYLTQLGLASSYAAGVLPALILLGLALGLILPSAIATAATGVLPQDTGVASALVNTMQQVGGSVGVSALSTVALSATANYLATHRDAGRLITPDAAIHGYTVAFTVAAIVFAVAAVLAFGLLPSRQRQQASGSLEDASVMEGPATEADAAAGDTHAKVKSPLLDSGVRTDGGTMTLLGLTPHTIYFSDRPERIVGHLTTHRFLQWSSEGDDSFAVDPPNAVLAWGEPGTDAPEEAVVVISDPSITADGLQYHVQTLQGTPPATAGPCVLFIDPLGRPLSPVSVAGVRRRDMRRDRRRL